MTLAAESSNRDGPGNLREGFSLPVLESAHDPRRAHLAMRPVLIAAALCASISVLAQPAYRSNDGQYATGSDNVSYAYARVTRVDPVYETVRTAVPEEVCDGRASGDRDEGRGGTIVGALVGAALGNQVGKGDGRDAATVAGAVIGGAVGGNIDRNNRTGNGPGCRVVQSVREQRRISAYDVEYVHQGQTYMSRLPYDPGDRLEVRVTVTPVDGGPAYR